VEVVGNFNYAGGSELLGLWALSIIQILNIRKNNVSETGSVSMLR
jgi:hypothetical protein